MSTSGQEYAPTNLETPCLPKAPRLSRADGNTAEFNEFKRRRFIMKIESVHFHNTPTHGTRVRCAVLLSATFILAGSDKLTFAEVPLLINEGKVASRAGKGLPYSEAVTADITENFPHKEEFVKVGHVDGVKVSRLSPEVMLELMGVGAGIGGMGTERIRSNNKEYLISLQPVRYEVEGQATKLSWHFKDEKGIFYPSTINFLVIVEKETENHDGWFPFRLQLGNDLEVKVKTPSWRNPIVTLVNSLTKHEGWQFDIRGNYCPEKAALALRQAAGEEEGEAPVGLRAAAVDWLCERQK
ncbi:hypothetical protein FA15DRAFT_709074 [Coprinopsis marcescibilis]|uniref:Uncharacterized protein n=1 Tax=Coprinopsis marcescibilis TaxID=230819 RepID=A0A5C3KGM4_COPMA|nr:hypothetical protein FA15DRAFT_709074 [Coprinopsis marcescibilis]